MKSINIVLFLMLFGLLFNSCEDDNNIPLNQIVNEPESEFSNNFGNSIEARFIGTVVNESNNPIPGVSITVGNAVALTDANGVFAVEEAVVYEKFAYLKASKAGYIDGSRAVVPSSGVNQIKVMLLKMDVEATINSGEQSTVALSNGAAIEFSGDFENTLGEAYNGSIEVTLKHLSPDNPNMNIMMPGMLFAENINGDPRVLESYGMFAVELRGSNNEELQLANGSTAQVSLPLPTTINTAPSTIPLWYFDEVNGYWKQEGEATLQGNSYVGEVTHFSFWNWDFQLPAITLCITLEDVDGNLLPNTQMFMQAASIAPTGTYGYTNNLGIECGLVPQDEVLTLVVPNFGCLGNHFSVEIGPFSNSENITVTVNGTNALTNFTGTFNDCSGNAITNGYMQLFYNNQSNIIPITNGEINQTIAYCTTNTAYSAQVIDLNTNQSTDIVTGNFATPTTDLGTEMSCLDLSDSDNDGVIDIDEDVNGDNNLDNDDTDQDGIPNYLDEDDDGDGVNTIDEDRDNDGNPMNDDSDGDQIPDYLDNQDVLVYDSEIFVTGCDELNSPYNLTQYYDTVSFPNNTFMYYETQADADAEVNPIANPNGFINTNALQMVFVKATNTITNQSATATIYLLGTEYQDSDQDGLTDCEEITGINEGDNNCNPNGNITDPNNPDSDGDGYNDCEEAISGTDPNDINDFPAISNYLNFQKDGIYEDVNGNNIYDLGDTIVFIFVVGNVGNETISDIYITDPMLGLIGLPLVPTALQPGQTGTASYTYNITQPDLDLGAVYNLASLEGSNNNGEIITETSIDPTPISSGNPFYDPDCPDCTVTIFE